MTLPSGRVMSDDVQDVYTNMDIPDDVAAALDEE